MDSKKSYPLVPKFLSSIPITYYFIMTCLIIFIVDFIIPIDIYKFLAVSFSGVLSGHYYELVTHIFGHQDLQHISGNLLYIVILMPFIELKLKPFHTFIILMASAILSGVLLMILNPHTATVGASGIVFTLLGLYLVFIKYMVHKIYALFLLIFIGLELSSNIFDNVFFGSNISIIGHISGLVIGILLGLLYLPKLNKETKKI